MRVLGLDIGGANLKAAHTDGTARSRAFEVWRRAGELGDAVAELIAGMPAADLVAVTMTAELCDSFETKADGVGAVLDALAAAVGRLAEPVPIRVWLTDGRLVPPVRARATPLRAAASNLLALATWAGRSCPEGPGLVIDVGSTTTDITPLRDGVPVPHGRTDLERLGAGELVYSGARRTPVFALVSTVRLGGRSYGVAAELFATTQDAYLVRGDLPDDAQDYATADGRPATARYARDRLCRVLCADRTMLAEPETRAIADQVAAAQLDSLVAAREKVEAVLGDPPRTIVLAGSGEFLGRKVAEADRPAYQEIISLGDRCGSSISSAACAYSLAVLASERWFAPGRASAAARNPSPFGDC